MLRLYTIFSSLLLISSSILCAQQQKYIFQHLTVKDGLASNLTRFIFQDSKGFYWIGYNNGFQKFDGKSFSITSFENKYVMKDLLEQTLISPLEDKKGNVYIPNQSNLYVFNPSGTVDTIKIFDYLDDSISDITDMCQDESGNVWISTYVNLYKYDARSNKCILWASFNKPENVGMGGKIVYDKNGRNIWLARENHIYSVNTESKKVTQPFLTKQPGINDLAKDFLTLGFWMDGDYNLWISSWSGFVYKYNTITYRKEKIEAFNNVKIKNQLDKSIPFCFTEDKLKHIWIGCLNGGLFMYDKPTNSINSIPVNNNVSYAFHGDNNTYPLYCDIEGNIWAGSNKGLNVFNPYLQQFNNVDENNLGSSFHKPDLTKIFQITNGDVLVSSWGKGWFLFDKNLQLKKQFYDSSLTSLKEKEGRKNFVWCFTEDKNGKIWIGYQYGLIGIFNPANQHIEYIDAPEFQRKTIRAIQCDSSGNMWFGLHSGNLVEWDGKQQKFFNYGHTTQRIKDAAIALTDLLIDKHGIIWTASEGNGFSKFNPITKKFIAHYVDDGENPLYDNKVQAFAELNDSVIGICNRYRGFLLFNENRKTFTSVSKQNGSPLTDVWGIAQDKQHHIWIATTEGLLRMNEKDKKVVSFDEEDGLLINKFQGRICKLSDGTLTIPGETGFVFFSPENITSLPTPPDVTITGFSIFDKPINIDSSLLNKEAIYLSHDQNLITISFSSISFLGRNTTNYYYKLDGVNKEWVHTNTERSINYSNLKPGNYVFKVKCENRDGIPSKNITKLFITISPPWWATWWAYSLYAITIGGIIYAIYYNRIKQLRKEQSAQINLMVATQEEERKRISRDLHDDIGTKLSALKLFLSSLQEKAVDINNDVIKKLATKSEQFITETIKDVRELLLNLSPTVLEEFGYTIAVEGLINKINETKQIYFSLVIFGLDQRLKKEYELALYRITQELINNVLKHAEAKNVSLQIGKRDSKIILMIEDDGKGFDVNAHKDGYGLHNLDTRTQMLHGKFIIESQPGKGTSVLIEIPDNLI